ncbi:hypothetical protein OVS_03945 [Mycoplasma ovis str. Michigan]|uniref:Uncharacterized protein n=1 Tax=Mycoplasma ovis str. Michigan TaxID=1415773 RepID=A0ABM5P256_9MOLU|nr:hypothetical protein [Mycoplasma ovis]AHC40520.1 hypothetical protein OVS_03945 [Mycoplasma ovis str. Michigan]
MKEIEQKLESLQREQEQFSERKKSLEVEIQRQEKELTSNKQSLEKVASRNVDIEGLKKKLKDKEDNLSKTKLEMETLGKTNSSSREENGKLQKEKDSLQKKLKELSYLEKIFAELSKERIKEGDIKDIRTYKAVLNNAITRRKMSLQNKRLQVWTDLTTLFGRERKGTNNNELARGKLIGDSVKEGEFLAKLREIFNSIEKI